MCPWHTDRGNSGAFSSRILAGGNADGHSGGLTEMFLQDALEPVGSAALQVDFVLLYLGAGFPSPDTKQLFPFCRHCWSCCCQGKHPRAGLGLSCARWSRGLMLFVPFNRFIQVKGGETPPELGKELRNWH